jgi:hypothetical protein
MIASATAQEEMASYKQGGMWQWEGGFSVWVKEVSRPVVACLLLLLSAEAASI